jgi:hypothetical protein
LRGGIGNHVLLVKYCTLSARAKKRGCSQGILGRLEKGLKASI